MTTAEARKAEAAGQAPPACPCCNRDWLQRNPKDPGHHIDLRTGIRPIREWGNACYRGFVSNARFAGANSTTQVIERTNRANTRKWRATGAAIHGGKTAA